MDAYLLSNYLGVFYCFFFLNRNKLNNIKQGKIIAHKIPILRLSLNKPDINPARVGPREQPTSPERASKANKTVPPFFIALDALLNVPGQRIPTENPHRPQPIKFIAGIGTSDINKYEPIHKNRLSFINGQGLFFLLISHILILKFPLIKQMTLDQLNHLLF